ncbi:MAG: 30S ribosomal protein S12 methylthiotransferase RimO [Deltaproteobacteria bacterium]|nr:30S ribosomal protein S12 methylthiotransferase RimO [Deltaproteobacteria bacterium]MBW2393217.1 30S ribosomal protein S12 methylthiotransferase RimO [Deltaproteobacteria bacterium]
MSTDSPKATVYFHSLGCPKNLLDTEVMLGSLATQGYALAEELESADVAVINTCSFIESAREESIQAILDVADLREQGALRALVVSGCLPQRFGAELAKELPEVDAFVGTSHYQDIATILDDALAGRGRGLYVEPGHTHLYDHETPRLLSGAGHSAYIKIAEGCDRVCAFCAIPGIRGRFQSRQLASVVAEAEQLAAAGVREINLVAQDSTAWGKDLGPIGEGGGRPRIAELLRGLDEVDGLEWVRLLYIYPTTVDEALLEVLANGKRVLPYVDMPLQHASDRLLQRMRRGTTAKRQRRLVERVRETIPHATLRTTYIVGFPGETGADFDELLAWVRETRFDRVGVFRYSDEEGTAGYDLEEKVPRELARERYQELTRVLSELMEEKAREQIGKERMALVEGKGPRELSIARLASQAPEVDGMTLLSGGSKLEPGQMVRCRITGVRDTVDLEADVVHQQG